MTCPICDNKPANCDCTELERRQHDEIERLTAEVERHRMTADTRDAIEKAVAALDGTWMQPVLRDFLDRTAPKEVGRE